MQLHKGKLLVAHIRQHPIVVQKAKEGNKLSSHQTDHGMTHFNEVIRLALLICSLLKNKKTNALTDWEIEVIIVLAALLHDIGRADDVDNHAAAGAKWSRDFLRDITLPGDTETLTRKDVNRICKIIACHRSGIVLKRDFDDICWAIVVLADKFAGDEERVRPFRAFILSILTCFRLSFIPLRRGGIHDRVNFAIKNVEIDIRDDELILRLTTDPRVCQGKLILDTYAERYLACHRAAKFMGLKFRFETLTKPIGLIARLRAATGFGIAPKLDRYAWDETAKQWQLCD
jgi:hypothetical protein